MYFSWGKLDQITLRLVINLRRLNFGCMLYRLHWFQVYIKTICPYPVTIRISLYIYASLCNHFSTYSKRSQMQQEWQTVLHFRAARNYGCSGWSVPPSSIVQKTRTYWSFFPKWIRNSVNSANSGNPINHWSMNWAQLKDPICCLCLAGAGLLHRRWQVWIIFLKYNIFCHWLRFSDNIQGKLKCTRKIENM